MIQGTKKRAADEDDITAEEDDMQQSQKPVKRRMKLNIGEIY